MGIGYALTENVSFTRIPSSLNFQSYHIPPIGRSPSMGTSLVRSPRWRWR
jgi:CO/xanthine dehydrogenase Mo-binding subunit